MMSDDAAGEPANDARAVGALSQLVGFQLWRVLVSREIDAPRHVMQERVGGVPA